MPAPDSKLKYSVFYNMYVLMFSHVLYCVLGYFTGIFYAVVRHMSMLFIDNTDSVFCVCVRAPVSVFEAGIQRHDVAGMKCCSVLILCN